MRTYSKRKRFDGSNLTLKRRRLEAVDLSPAIQASNGRDSSVPVEALASTPISELDLYDPALFSDENAPISSPPSSPPALLWDTESLPTKDTAEEVSAFAPLDRRPLETVDHRARNKDNQTVTQPPKSKKRLVQMQINLGQSFQKQCKTCGMDYIPSNTEDAALHRKFHAQNVGGVDLDRSFIKKMEESSYVQWRGKAGDLIVMLERGGTTTPAMRRTQTVLDVVRSELGAVDITHNMLYSECDVELPFPSPQDQKDIRGWSDEGPRFNRYKIYLYLRGTKCVGVCLAERINKAYKVVDPDEQEITDGVEQGNPAKIQNIRRSTDERLRIADVADPAWLGISRIWTSGSARQGGVATALLEVTRKTFRQGKDTPLDLMAFSQPTESGARLARRWFGRQYGWHVYID